MSDYTPEDIVKSAIAGDAVNTKDAINGVLAGKVMKALEAKKATVAQAMFNNAVVGDKPEVAEPTVKQPEQPIITPDNGMTTTAENEG